LDGGRAGVVTGVHRVSVRRGVPEPSAQVALLADLGVDGDHHVQAGSLRQVVLSLQEVLDDLGLRAGVVREQLTVGGIPDVRAGDELRFPSGARVRLTRTRVPCGVMNKIRPGLRNEMAGRGGWCARVLSSGLVALGDAVEVARTPYSPPVDAYLLALTRWEEAGAPKFDGVIGAHEAALGVDTSAIADRWLRIDVMSTTLVDAGAAGQLGVVASALDSARAR
jgi:MOSC domain-containing protein YiiM